MPDSSQKAGLATTPVLATSVENITSAWEAFGFVTTAESSVAQRMAKVALAAEAGPDPIAEEHLDENMLERIEIALTAFVFPGVVVPRREMAQAVVRALSHQGDPRIGTAKHIVRTGATDA